MSPRRRAGRASFSRLREKLGGNVRLGVVLAVLVGVNIYVFFFSQGSLKQVQQAAQAASTRAPTEDALVDRDPGSDSAPASLAPGAVAGAPAAPKARPKKHDGAIREHEGLGAMLRRESLLPKDADATLRALAPVLNFKKEVRPGLAYTVRLDAAGRLDSFELHLPAGVVCAVTRGADGKLAAERLASAPRPGHH